MVGGEPSVGSVGDSYDVALAEAIDGLQKAEAIHRRGPWRSFESDEFATLEWVDWFHNRRLLEPIGAIPPAQAELRNYVMKNQQDIAAQLIRNGLRQTRGGSVFAASHDPASLQGDVGDSRVHFVRCADTFGLREGRLRFAALLIREWTRPVNGAARED